MVRNDFDTEFKTSSMPNSRPFNPAFCTQIVIVYSNTFAKFGASSCVVGNLRAVVSFDGYARVMSLEQAQFKNPLKQSVGHAFWRKKDVCI